MKFTPVKCGNHTINPDRAFPVLKRRLAGEGREAGREMALILKTDLMGDFSDGKIRKGEKFLGFCDAAVYKKAVGCRADILPKLAHQVGFGKMRAREEIIYCDLLPAVGADVVRGFQNPLPCVGRGPVVRKLLFRHPGQNPMDTEACLHRGFRIALLHAAEYGLEGGGQIDSRHGDGREFFCIRAVGENIKHSL